MVNQVEKTYRVADSSRTDANGDDNDTMVTNGKFKRPKDFYMIKIGTDIIILISIPVKSLAG